MASGLLAYGPVLTRAQFKLSISLLALGGIAGLSSPATGAHRFHRLTPALRDRLSPGAQAVAGGVVEITHATGFLIQRTRTRGLVLTNEHVAGRGVTPGEKLRFLDGSEGRALRLVAKDAVHDYALVEVSLPKDSKARALSLRPAAIRPARPIYSVAAYANLGFSPARAGLGGGPSAERAVAAGPRNQFAIAVGETRSETTHGEWRKVGSKRLKGVAAIIPNAPGMSGSPILDRETHEVVGLHSSGTGIPAGSSGAWTETFIPLRDIINDISAKAQAGKLPDSALPLVRELIRSTR